MPAEGADEGGSSGEGIIPAAAFSKLLKKTENSAREKGSFLNSEKNILIYC